MKLAEASCRMFAGTIMILPATALACLPFALAGMMLNDMTGMWWMFLIYELGGALLGLIVLDSEEGEPHGD